MTEIKTLEDWVVQAANGDRAALQHVLLQVKDQVYGLALRMLWHPADAEDATQEALIRITTQLSRFEGHSRFRTWAYRVATRSILNTKRGRVEGHWTFEAFSEDLLEGSEPAAPAGFTAPELALLRQEVKIACTQAMLLCLDRPHRMTYLLGEVLQLPHQEAASILELDNTLYRKRLSRARLRVQDFTVSHCSLVNRQAPCRCEGRVGTALKLERIDPKRLLFSEHPVTTIERDQVAQVTSYLQEASDGGALMRSNPQYKAPDYLLEILPD